MLGIFKCSTKTFLPRLEYLNVARWERASAWTFFDLGICWTSSALKFEESSCIF